MGRIKIKRLKPSGTEDPPVGRPSPPRKYSDEQLSQVHKDCFKNEHQVDKATEAGCFYCLTVFPPTKIDEWWDEGPSRTAVCPWCGVDSVILPQSHSNVDPALLVEMQAKYFDSALAQIPDYAPDRYSLAVNRKGF